MSSNKSKVFVNKTYRLCQDTAEAAGVKAEEDIADQQAEARKGETGCEA